MIGSHNSFTYLKAVNGNLFNKFASFWRCQDKSIQEQYDSGVHFYDVRVTEETFGGKNMWRVCHGKVNVNKLFVSLKVLVKSFLVIDKNIKLRIIYEKGDSLDKFTDEVSDVITEYKDNITQVVAKDDWKVIYENWGDIRLIDYSYVPFQSNKSFLQNLKTIKLSTIKKWATKHNPEITQEMIDDKSTIYFMDYV